jgi:hypothetical protein
MKTNSFFQPISFKAIILQTGKVAISGKHEDYPGALLSSLPLCPLQSPRKCHSHSPLARTKQHFPTTPSHLLPPPNLLLTTLPPLIEFLAPNHQTIHLHLLIQVLSKPTPPLPIHTPRYKTPRRLPMQRRKGWIDVEMGVAGGVGCQRVVRERCNRVRSGWQKCSW